MTAACDPSPVPAVERSATMSAAEAGLIELVDPSAAHRVAVTRAASARTRLDALVALGAALDKLGCRESGRFSYVPTVLFRRAEADPSAAATYIALCTHTDHGDTERSTPAGFWVGPARTTLADADDDARGHSRGEHVKTLVAVIA